MKKKMHESAPKENVGTLPEHAAGLEGHEKRTQDALLALSNTQKKLAETSEKINHTINIDDTLNSVRDLEARWEAFQKSFEDMNKKMVANIAASLGATHLSETSEPVEHSPISMNECIRLVENAQSIVVMTGAGVSVESGIPTYRGAGGTWTKGSKNYRPQELATFRFFEEHPEKQWEYMFETANKMQRAKPNDTHIELAELEKYCNRCNKSFTLITQNIDSLHRKGGSNNVLEIHGNIGYARCMKKTCPKFAELVPFPSLPNKKEKSYVPTCTSCQSNIRPHVLFFDECYSERLYKSESAKAAVATADVFLVIGTTYQTSLPRKLLHLAHKHDAAIIDVNPNPNDTVQICSLNQIRQTSTKFMKSMLHMLQKKKKK